MQKNKNFEIIFKWEYSGAKYEWHLTKTPNKFFSYCTTSTLAHVHTKIQQATPQKHHHTKQHQHDMNTHQPYPNQQTNTQALSERHLWTMWWQCGASGAVTGTAESIFQDGGKYCSWLLGNFTRWLRKGSDGAIIGVKMFPSRLGIRWWF